MSPLHCGDIDINRKKCTWTCARWCYMSRQPNSNHCWDGWELPPLCAGAPLSTIAHNRDSRCQLFPFILTGVAIINALLMKNNKMCLSQVPIKKKDGTTQEFLQPWSFRDPVNSQGMVLLNISLLYLVWCWHFLCGWTLLLFTYCCHDNSVSSVSLIFPALCLVLMS